MNRVGKLPVGRLCVRGAGPAVLDHANELLGVQRVAARALQQLSMQARSERGTVQHGCYQLCGLAVSQRGQSDRRDVGAAAAPRRGGVVELRAGRRHQHHRNPAGPLGQVVHEVQHDFLCPVQILDHDDEGRVRRNALEVCLGSSECLLRRRLATGQSEQRAETRDDPVDLAVLPSTGRRSVAHNQLNGLTESSGDAFLIVGVEHSRVGFDDLRQWPERRGSIRETAALPPGHELVALVDPLEELLDEARLPDAGLTDQRHELRRSLPRAAGERPLQDLKLVDPADEWQPGVGDGLTDPRSRPERLPQRHRLRLALDLDGRQLLVVDDVPCRPPGRLADDHRARLGCSLKPRGRVDHVARDHSLAKLRARGGRHHGRAGIDADANREPQTLLLVQLVDSVQEREACSHGALRIVLVDCGRAERRHHGIANEFLDGPAEPLDLTSTARVVRRETRLNLFRVGTVRSGREADEITEEDGDALALTCLRCTGLGELGAALPAEVQPGWVIEPARLAHRHTHTLGTWSDTHHEIRQSVRPDLACPPCLRRGRWPNTDRTPSEYLV